MSDPLWHHRLQHARFFCLPLSSISQSLLKFMVIELVILPNHFILCHPSLSFNLSQHQSLFQWVSSSHQVAEKWSISCHVNKQECHSHQQLQRSPGPSFLCSPHNESERQGAEARKRLYSGRHLTKKRLVPQNNHLIGVWAPSSFIDQDGRSEEARWKGH